MRKKAKLTTRQVEACSGVSNSYLSLLENGKRGIPSPDVIKKLAPCLNVSFKDLMSQAGYLPPITMDKNERVPSQDSVIRSQAVLSSVLRRCEELGLSDLDVALEAGILDLNWWEKIKNGDSFEFPEQRIEMLADILKLTVQEVVEGNWDDVVVSHVEREFIRWVKSMVGRDFLSDWYIRSNAKKEMYMKAIQVIYDMDRSN